MFYSNSVQFPALFSFLLRLEKSPSGTKMQFILDPLAIPEVVDVLHILGQPALQHIMYLGRTFAYYLYREKQITSTFLLETRYLAALGSNQTRKITIFKSASNKVTRLPQHPLITGGEMVWLADSYQ